MTETPTEPDTNGTAATVANAAADAAAARRYPLRFVWQIDAAGRFGIGPGEFISLTGSQTAAALGRPWDEVAATLALDPAGDLKRALATHETWSGLLVAWPVDGSDERLTVELSGLPVFDRDRIFRGYRGFGVCRDLERLAALAQSRLGPAIEPSPPEVDEPQTASPPAENGVPWPTMPPPEVKAPSLSPVERHAFSELARRLTQRLSQTSEDETELTPDTQSQTEVAATPVLADLAGPETAPSHPQAHAAAVQSDFLARVSHEIRTPLNTIIGFCEVMLEERFGPVANDRYRQYLNDIHSSGGRLVALVDDLLDLSRIEAGRLEIDFTSVAINELVTQCVAGLQPQAKQARIIIRSSLSPKLPQVVADMRSLRQIVMNLLANSIKFTGNGGQVIVSTALTDRGEVVLRVRDSGVGMSATEIAAATAPFSELATSTRFGSGGADLRLALSKALAEANRANFHIESKLRAGTLVEVSFPSTCLWAE
jgi:signal transduction histidine kinase